MNDQEELFFVIKTQTFFLLARLMLEQGYIY